VEFASPVTRGRDREQFRIQMAWEQRGAEPTRAPSVAPTSQRPVAPAAPVPAPAARPGSR